MSYCLLFLDSDYALNPLYSDTLILRAYSCELAPLPIKIFRP